MFVALLDVKLKNLKMMASYKKVINEINSIKKKLQIQKMLTKNKKFVIMYS